MADSKISALTSLASGHATGDLLPIVDVSDTTQAASGTTKQTTLANLLANLPGPTNAVGISYTGQSLTGSNASNLLSLAATWNTTGTPTAVKLNVTDTASNASSLLMDLQVGGVSKISFTKDGSINATSGAITSFNVAANANLRVSSGVTFNASTSGAVVTTLFGLNGTNATAAPDVSIMRSAAAVLGIRNGSTGGGALEYIEQTAPAAGAANSCRVYAVDNGAGKTQLMALFGSGAAQQLAIEP